MTKNEAMRLQRGDAVYWGATVQDQGRVVDTNGAGFRICWSRDGSTQDFEFRDVVMLASLHRPPSPAVAQAAEDLEAIRRRRRSLQAED